MFLLTPPPILPPLPLWSFLLWVTGTAQQADIISGSSTGRVICILIIRSLDISWLFHIASFMAPAGDRERKPPTSPHYGFVHFHYGNFQVSVFVLNFRMELIICTLNHTLDHGVFSFNFNLLLKCSSTQEREFNAQVSVRITGGLLHTVSHTFLWLSK